MRFPWSAAVDRPKDVERKIQTTIPMAMARHLPVVEIPVVNRQKRAHLHDNDAGAKHAPKRSRKGSVAKAEPTKPKQHKQSTEVGAAPSPGVMSGRKIVVAPTGSGQQTLNSAGPPPKSRATRPPIHSQPSSSTTSPSSSMQLKQTIQSQFGLEILLKHQELRLIEQELAKCQTAYEQLRRCALVPYEASDSTPAAQISSTGSQAHIANASDPSDWRTSPAILNGPYTRHYARWLIPDPRFDGEMVSSEGKQENARIGKRPMEGRATRGSFAEHVPQAGKARGRGIAGSTNAYVPSPSTSQSKDKAGPLVLKRSSDGQMVKLVCLDCDRGDFSSAQGFINHCRIAHHRGFESHDAAANACGQVVEFDETGQVIDEGDPGSAGTVALVHPLIRLAPTTRPPPLQRPWRDGSGEVLSSSDDNDSVKESKEEEWRKAQELQAAHRPAAAAPRASIMPTPSNRFTSSPQTPHLSALMKSKGHDGDLGKMVGEAKIKYDLESSSSEEEEDEEDEDAPHLGLDGSDDRPPSRGTPGGSRMPARAGVSPAPLVHSGSNKGVERSRKPGLSNGFFSRSLQAQVATSPTPALPTRSRPARRQVDDVTLPPIDLSSPNLSPNTLDAATAPSLVSDDGEYEAHTDSEALDSEEADEVEYGVDFDVEEGDEMGGSDDTAATDPELGHGASPSPKTPVPKRTALRRGTSALNNRRCGAAQRHVSFVSPVKEAEVKGRGARRGVRK